MHRIARPCKDSHHRLREKERCSRRQNRNRGNHLKAHGNYPFKLSGIPLTPVITQHRRNPVRISRIEGACEHQHIHDDRDRGNPLLARGLEHHPVKRQRDDSRDKRARHLGAPVSGGSNKHPRAKRRSLKMKETAFPAKHNKPRHRSHRIPKPRSHRSAANPRTEHTKKQIVKGHVQNPSRHRTGKRKRRLPACDHIEGKIVHQKNRNRKQKIAAQIFLAVCRHLKRQPKSRKRPVHQHISQNAHSNPHRHIYSNQKCKILPRLSLPLLPHLLHDHRAAPGGKHGRDRGHKLDKRRGQVDRRQSFRSDKVRYKQAVNHRVK